MHIDINTLTNLNNIKIRECALVQLQGGPYLNMSSVLLLMEKNPDVTGFDRHVLMRSKASFASLLTRVHHKISTIFV